MKPQYVCTQNGKAKITISKKEEKYTSAIKGAKLKILKTPKKYLLKIVNVYAPHSEITITFYNDLNNLLNQINNKSSIAVVDGNFNGETGEKNDIDKCLGIFSGGRRKQNGQHLINLCMNHDLLITNTCFRHKEKRLITWEQTRIVQGKLQKLKKTIDYIFIPYKYKHMLENSRTCHRTTTASDHKLLVTKMVTNGAKYTKMIINKKTKKSKI